MAATFDPADTFSLPPPPGFVRSSLDPPPRSNAGPGCSQFHSLFRIPDTGRPRTHIRAGLNSKLAAANSPSKALISRAPTLVIGMELARPPRNPRGPLLAALVHSRAWPKISEYRAVSIEMPREWETIKFLYNPETGSDGKSTDVGIIRELLDDFCKSSGNKKPEQIIILRYGATESQLSQVLEAELDQITQACKFFDDKCPPKLVVIKFFEPDNALPRANYDGIGCGAEIDDFAETWPSQHKTELNEAGLSPSELEELVDSLSYVHRMCIEAISYAGWIYAGSNSSKIEEPEQKRTKTEIEPDDLDDVDLQREREQIRRGDTLAVYALGLVNAEKGGKYKFERFLHRECGYFGYEDSDMKVWDHVSMFVEETKGEVVSRKIVFAELSYFEGKYDTIKHVVLDPNEPQGIVYGCGLCAPGSPGGDYQSPHPADETQYEVGHWPRVLGFRAGGIIPKSK